MEYIEEFVKPSNIHEALFCGYLWNTPVLYEKFKNHKITQGAFTEKIWWFYYRLGLEMFSNSIREFDDTTVYSFVTTRPKETNRKGLFDFYDDYGGYNVIEEVMEECKKSNQQNEEYHFSEIQKYESLRKFQEEGLVDTLNKELVKKVTTMNLTQLQSYMQFKSQQIFANVNSGEVVEYELNDNLDETIDQLNEGEAMGMPISNAPRLNKRIKGWKKGEMIYLCMASGMGKSSYVLEKFVLSLYENNQKGMIFSNEESVLKNRTLLLATVASSVLNRPVNREKITEGNFDEKMLSKLHAAKDWLQEKPTDLIKFYDMKKYRAEDVISRISMMKPLGYNYVLIDTFKNSVGSEGARWEAFSADAVAIHNSIKAENNNMGLIATVQLKIGKEYRFLDLSAIGKSMEIVEVAATVLMGRLLYADEYPEEREAIFCYNWEKSDFTGKWEKVEYILDKEKEYIVLFLAKSRNSAKEEQIIYEANYSINQFKEVAYCKIGKKANTMF